MSESGQPPTEEAPEEMMLGANLEEFAQRVSIIVSLESNGKIPVGDAYAQIKGLWKSVKHSRKSLGLKATADSEPDRTEPDQGNGSEV